MRDFCFKFVALLFLSATLASWSQSVSLAPGWSALQYELPAPGTYQLPPLGKAADGSVLDLSGKTKRLHSVYENRIVLLSFFYRSCCDVNGCPLSTAALSQVRRAARNDPELANHLKLISLSFDPSRDTPDALREYAEGFDRTERDWIFLTTTSERELEPILADYQQLVKPDLSGDFSHPLRIFLIDRKRRIRNIYSAAVLHAELLINDVKSLLVEESIAPSRPERQIKPPRSSGKLSTLMELAKDPPLGLPKFSTPVRNPLTKEKVSLGRKLFFDRRLSLNGTISCAMCHVPEQGFTHNEMATSVGIEGRGGRRNAPSLYNVAFATTLFHDGRENKLEQQVWLPFLARNEMGNPSIAAVVNKIEESLDYGGLFETAFDGKGPTVETIGQAIASYERTLLSANSPFDRWRSGETQALNPQSKRGFELFIGKAQCATCHAVSGKQALFTDNKWHNTGVGYAKTMLNPPNVSKGSENASTRLAPSDLGRYEVTQNPRDRWVYKTPSLRNVALTAPYMHDGSFKTLEEIIAFYNRGGVPNEGLSPTIRPLDLSDSEIRDLTAFLLSLTGDNIDLFVDDAMSARTATTEQ